MIAIGCDHGGFPLKKTIIDEVVRCGYEYKDFGCMDENSVDYPAIAKAVAESIASGECERGILICGTGIGISIAANKVKGIRAANCENTFSARMCREHNDAHILCLGARVVGPSVAADMTAAFLGAEFLKGRHERRVNMIREMED